jgi:hypothetical protein
LLLFSTGSFYIFKMAGVRANVQILPVRLVLLPFCLLPAANYGIYFAIPDSFAPTIICFG